MEELKPIEEFKSPDERIRHPKDLPYNLYKNIENCILNENVPENVRTYFEMLRNVYVHGWYYYPFCTMAVFLSYFAIEMALRECFKEEDPKRKKTFRYLMRKAVKKGLIKAGKFSHVRERWERSKELEKVTGGLTKAFPQTEEYCSVIAESIPNLRNAFAHPQHRTLLLLGQSAVLIKISSELINQLFENLNK